MKKLFTSFILICLAITIFSQAPQKFNYQAVVRDSEGNPLSGKSVSFQISLLSGSESGTAVYTETQSVTSNTNGVVTLQVGNGTTSDDFSAIDWSSNSYYLKVEMDAAGGTNYVLYSNTQLLSVPYALYARKASTVDSVRTILDTDGDTRIYVEKYDDEDYIRFYTNGSEKLRITPAGIVVPANTSYNSAFGLKSILNQTSGMRNSAFGAYTLYALTTGNNNTAIGCQSLHNLTTGSNNSALGLSALYAVTTGNYNSSFGTESMSFLTTGSYNSAFGYYAGTSNITGSRNTFIGYYADVSSANLTNATAIGNNAKVTASNTIMLGNSSVTNVYSYGAFGNPSDRRLKENIIYTNKLGLDFILKLKTASYNYIADSAKHRRDGLIAQDVQQALANLGIEFSGLSVDDNADKTMNLSYSEFVIPLINAVQEQQKSIELQKEQISTLKQQNELLFQIINELKKK